MTPELKQQWVKTLRSGQYAQGKGQLRIPGKPDRYCCLGVLQEIAGVVKKVGTSAMPSAKTQRQMGITAVQCQQYCVYNDGGKSFIDIANIIEKDKSL